MVEAERAWIVGCGDVGRRLAQALQAEGLSIMGWVRQPESAARLAAEGIPAQALDLDETALPPPPATVYWLAAPPERGREDPRLARTLTAWRAAGVAPARLLLLSTSAVYGDCAGRWIEEDEPPHPGTDRGHRRWHAEQQALAYAGASGCALLRLRVPGIYGPGRLPVARLRRGDPVLRPEEAGYSNRIQVEDLVGILQRAGRAAAPGSVYHAVDDEPSSMSDYFNRCADLLGLPRPPALSRAEAKVRLSPELMSYLEESRRLSNRRLKAELGYRLRYPGLSQGLPACLPA